MTTDRLPEGGFAGLVPELDVFDLERSLKFWCGGLGFVVAYARPEAGFAYLERDGVQVMLNRVNGNWSVGALEPPLGRGLNLQITVATLEPVLVGLAAGGSPLFRGVHDAWYRAGSVEIGLRQVLVQDPDGYLLRLCEALGTRSVDPVLNLGGPASSP
ncbi:bleomycin resistance protein [Methylobacterium sp. J-090]|uniref:bleomycin resistance protein n=1 Tax=Methylobacterium sp. J-090 TaxID=2836666 RepID=UPI001FB86F33|nr:VOC family protein [Methylobacterium sp. J-090]MCJ2083675.1 VOC family protein [Methylobacterium sp. J-090]